MKRLSLVCAALGCLALILDSRCAAEGAAAGLELCLRTVLPGLFPLFVLSGILLPQLYGLRFPSFLSRFLGIPKGAEGLFLLGLLGGFPMGAGAVAQAVRSRRLSKADGESMLGICCQCGPAFLFGMLPAVFGRPEIPALCFLLQLESVLLLAHLRRGCTGAVRISAVRSPSLSEAVSGAVRAMGTVCAWIVLACVAGRYVQNYLTPLLPQGLSFLLGAGLELAGGCLSLRRISDPGLRLVLCAGLLSFGGVCVLLQIRALAAEAGLSMGRCLRQKLLQSALSMALAAGTLRFGPFFLLFPIPAACLLKKQWKNSATCGIIAPIREGCDHAVS